MKGSFLNWVVVSNIEEARKFFKGLGLTELNYDARYKWAEFKGEEGAMIGVAADDGHSPIKPGQNAVITLTVEDINKSIKDLSAKGVKMVGEIMEVPGHVKMQLFQDKDGNYFQLVESLDK